MNLLEQLLWKREQELRHSRPEDITQTRYDNTEPYNKKYREKRRKNRDQTRRTRKSN